MCVWLVYCCGGHCTQAIRGAGELAAHRCVAAHTAHARLPCREAPLPGLPVALCPKIIPLAYNFCLSVTLPTPPTTKPVPLGSCVTADGRVQDPPPDSQADRVVGVRSPVEPSCKHTTHAGPTMHKPRTTPRSSRRALGPAPPCLSARVRSASPSSCSAGLGCLLEGCHPAQSIQWHRVPAQGRGAAHHTVRIHASHTCARAYRRQVTRAGSAAARSGQVARR